MYVMLSDLLPVAKLPTVHGFTTSSPYLVKYSSGETSTEFFNKMNNNTVWKGLLAGTSLAGSDFASVRGGIDLPTWIASWESVEDRSYNLQYNEYDGRKDGLPAGYMTKSYKTGGSSGRIDSVSGLIEGNGSINSLFFPRRRSNEGDVYYYTLTTAVRDLELMYSASWYDGYYRPSSGGVSTNGMSIRTGVRPVVYLNSNISVKKDANGVWKLQD